MAHIDFVIRYITKISFSFFFIVFGFLVFFFFFDHIKSSEFRFILKTLKRRSKISTKFCLTPFLCFRAQREPPIYDIFCEFQVSERFFIIKFMWSNIFDFGSTSAKMLIKWLVSVDVNVVVLVQKETTKIYINSHCKNRHIYNTFFIDSINLICFLIKMFKNKWSNKILEFVFRSEIDADVDADANFRWWFQWIFKHFSSGFTFMTYTCSRLVLNEIILSKQNIHLLAILDSEFFTLSA